jgi:maltose O-acetyltransferase
MRGLTRLWPSLFRDVVLNTVIASSLFPKPLRWRALRAYGMNVERCNVAPGVWFGSGRVSIGADSFINYGCQFNTSARISIGARCDIAMQVLFVTSSHEVGGPHRRAGRPTAEPIVVGDGCWIGARSVILPGVTIGAGTIVAAGSVVVRDCDTNSLYAGVPALKVRDMQRSDELAATDGIEPRPS